VVGRDLKARIQAAVDAGLGDDKTKLHAKRDAAIAECEAVVAMAEETDELLTLELAEAPVGLSMHRGILIPLNLLQVVLLAKYSRGTMPSKEFPQKLGSHEKRFRAYLNSDLCTRKVASRRARRASPRSSGAQTWRPWPAK